MGGITVSGLAQADDTALMSNETRNLKYLLHLTEIYCLKYQVRLCAEKTQLQAFSTKDMSFAVDYAKKMNPIQIDGKTIEFVNDAEHVGRLRSSDGNLPAILARFKAYKKAVAAVLHTGMARGHRGNPQASLRVHQLYGTPVLMSGLAPLVLSKQEVQMIEQQYKETLRCLLRLHEGTPRSVVYFLAGSLPGTAVLHLRQLSVFGMVCRLPGSILHKHATDIFSFATYSTKSWFFQIRELCLCYNLPHPQDLLRSPPTKEAFKKRVKSHVIDYWEKMLREEISALTSLEFFKPGFMSVSKPHPIWTTPGSSPAKIAMATIQAQMLSGRYRTEKLCSHWSNRKSGVCLLDHLCSSTTEDLQHILKHCPALKPARDKLIRFTIEYCHQHLPIFPLVQEFCQPSHPQFCQFLLDCSILPEVITATQLNGFEVLATLFHITRTWCYTLHKERLKMLGRWNPF